MESLVNDKDGKFRCLVCKVYVHLEKVIGGNLNEFKVFMTMCPHSWKQQGITWARSDLEAIISATTLMGVFLTLNQYWDYTSITSCWRSLFVSMVTRTSRERWRAIAVKSKNLRLSH